MSIHDNWQALNYYASIEISCRAPAAQLEDLVTIAGGKYASFSLIYNREWLIQEMINLKYHLLDTTDYEIRELNALEEFLDDTFRNRKI